MTMNYLLHLTSIILKNHLTMSIELEEFTLARLIITLSNVKSQFLLPMKTCFNWRQFPIFYSTTHCELTSCFSMGILSCRRVAHQVNIVLWPSNDIYEKHGWMQRHLYKILQKKYILLMV